MQIIGVFLKQKPIDADVFSGDVTCAEMDMALVVEVAMVVDMVMVPEMVVVKVTEVVMVLVAVLVVD